MKLELDVKVEGKKVSKKEALKIIREHLQEVFTPKKVKVVAV